MTSYGLQRRRQTGNSRNDLTQRQDWHKEKIYRDRIAALMETEEHTLSSYAKIKLWEDGPNYQKVVTYVNNSQCHEKVRLEVVNIHRVWRRGYKDNFFENGDPKSASKRMFLWHGTKRVNIPQILDTGFKLPPSSGQMFGAGIYFADRITKSTNYSDSDITFLLLCEVAIGKVYSCAQAHNDWIAPPRGFDSVKANGMYVPDWTSNAFYYGAQIPFGKTAKCTKYPTHAVNYNEFIVYDPQKIIIRFLVEVKVRNVFSPLTLVVPKDQTYGPMRRVGNGTTGRGNGSVTTGRVNNGLAYGNSTVVPKRQPPPVQNYTPTYYSSSTYTYNPPPTPQPKQASCTIL